MTQQIINIGTGPDSYTGDNLRTAFQKINENFSQLYAGNLGGNLLADTITANNLVSGGNITAGNITALQSLVSQGNVSGAYFIGDGSQLTGIAASNLGNLIITGVNQQTIAGTANASIVFEPVAGRSILYPLRSPSNVQVNLSIVSLTDNTVTISSGGNVVLTSPNLNLFSTGPLSIGANSNPSTTTTGRLKINHINGHMGFGTDPDGYTFTFRGDIFGNAFYAAENITTGYSFATPGGLTGLNHLYQDDVHGNVSLVRISHDNAVPAKFYENNHTILSGNLVVSQFGNVFGAGFPDAFIQIYSNVDSYSQLVLQNLNNGASSTGDIVVTADTGSDISHFIDMGIAGSNYDNTNPSNSLGTSVYPLDAYLYAQGNNPGDTGGNLTIGAATPSKVVRVIAGGVDAGNVITITSNVGFEPGANVTYSLGSADKQWKDLWVSNNTIYLGGVSLSVSADGNLLVNGNAVSGGGAASTGNITFADTTIGAPIDSEITVAAKDAVRDRAKLRLEPTGGDVYLEAWSGQNTRSENDTNWSTGVWENNIYGNPYMRFTGAFDLAFFVVDTLQSSADPDTVSYSINGGPYIAWDGGSSVDTATGFVEIYTSGVSPNVSPTAITTLDWRYAYKSSIAISNNSGAMQFSAKNQSLQINVDQYIQMYSKGSIELNNSNSGNNVDIEIRSGDDILLQGKNKTTSDSEGGDINIYAGQGGDADAGDAAGGGGDISIIAGRGGAPSAAYPGGLGGTVDIYGGQGADADTGLGRSARNGGRARLLAGSAGSNGGNIALGALGGEVEILAGQTTQENQNGGFVRITSGGAGPNALAGYVEITIPSSDLGQGGDWTFTGNGRTFEVPQDSEIWQPNFGNFSVGSAGNVFIRSVEYSTSTQHNWKFGDDGNLTAPGNITTLSGNVLAYDFRQVSPQVHLGQDAGNTSQGSLAIAIGRTAGRDNQGIESVSIGADAGQQNQGAYSIAIGSVTAYLNQGFNAVAIGTSAGAVNQGNNSVAIGGGAGSGQADNSIVINANGSTLTGTNAGLYIDPVRLVDGANVSLSYNTSTKEITYSANTFVSNTYVPSTAASAGTIGQISFDGDYVYICVAPDTWKRANLSTW